MEVMSLGDRTPDHLLSYMKSLWPKTKDQESIFFRTIWLDALPESVKDHISVVEGVNGAKAANHANEGEANSDG